MYDISKRAQERKNVEWISVIRLVDGAEIPCTIKDVSVSGMRLVLADTIPLPEVFVIKVIGRDLVFQVRQVWRRQHQAGLSIIKIGKLQKPKGLLEGSRNEAEPARDYTRIGERERYSSRNQ
jgi:hypothetical protein